MLLSPAEERGPARRRMRSLIETGEVAAAIEGPSYVDYLPSMRKQPQLTPQAARVMESLVRLGEQSGADLTRRTGIKSGTLYPLLLRLEQAGWVASRWEAEQPHDLGRPRRRFYHVTGVGAAHAREQAAQHAAVFQRLAPT